MTHTAADLTATLAELVNDSREALLAMSFDGRVLVWNRAAEAMFGYTAEEALGQILAELITPAEQNGDAPRAGSLRSRGARTARS
jgi:PAS domain S-box-containing protein